MGLSNLLPASPHTEEMASSWQQPLFPWTAHPPSWVEAEGPMAGPMAGQLQGPLGQVPYEGLTCSLFPGLSPGHTLHKC